MPYDLIHLFKRITALVERKVVSHAAAFSSFTVAPCPWKRYLSVSFEIGT